MGQKGTEAADAAGRGLLIPAPSHQPPSMNLATVTFSEYLGILRVNRRTYPPPEKIVTEEEEYTLTKLKTNYTPGTPRHNPLLPALPGKGGRVTHGMGIPVYTNYTSNRKHVNGATTANGATATTRPANDGW